MFPDMDKHYRNKLGTLDEKISAGLNSPNMSAGESRTLKDKLTDIENKITQHGSDGRLEAWEKRDLDLRMQSVEKLCDTYIKDKI